MQKLFINAANATITKNNITQISQTTFPTVNSHLITNNIVFDMGLSNSGATPILNSTISNNNIYGRLWANASIITNNIFSSSTAGTNSFDPITGTTNSVTNNISTYYTLPTSNGNLNSTIAAIFAVNPHSATPVGLDKHYQLAVSSPAIGAGTGGTDCGIFGGSSPYVLSGQPSSPIITILNSATAGNTATPLNVSVTVRGNN